MSIFWLALFLVLLVAEGVTQALVTIWFAFGALIVLIITTFGAPLWLQLIVFAISSALMLYYLFPIAKKKLKVGQARTNVDDLEGKEVVVTKKIEFNKIGAVSINGVSWSANSTEEINEGERVKIVDIEGNKVIVKKT